MWIQSALLERHGFRHAFTDRTGGVSAAPFDSLNLARNVGDDAEAVEANHRRVVAALGVAPAPLHEVSQVHGTRVRELRSGEDARRVRAEEADALIARDGQAVAVRVADCVPVLVADRTTGAVAAVHAGWRGTADGVLPAAVHALAPVSPSDLLVALGPHIRPAAFEVGGEVIERLRAAAPGTDPEVRGHAKPHADLAVVLRAQLAALGVPESNVEDVGGCTFAEAERFFSFRRDGKLSGRQAGVIVARSLGRAALP
ncbi:MAG: peptidoglycan editing factor PgeF [Polyangiales bacterium]|nr:peptidoglycan editing factor PgeF [Myxococcales bacterium]